MAESTDDPVEAIKNSKTPVQFSSEAGGDSLVHDRPSFICTRWHSIYPPAVYCHNWHCIDERLNDTPGLNPCDTLKIEHTTTHNSVWVHVQEVSAGLMLTAPADSSDTMYLEFENGWSKLGIGFADSAIFPPLNGDTLHEKRPINCQRYSIAGWKDHNNNALLDVSDSLALARVGLQDTTWWQVRKVKTAMDVFSIPYPDVPTFTQWGVIVLVALLISSAVYITLRKRRKATMVA